MRRAFSLVAMLGVIVIVPTAQPPEFLYPATHKVTHTDTYHGVRVADPYRWLEDDTSAETANWVEAQNKVTFEYFDRIPVRAELKTRLQRLYDYPKYLDPFQKGGLVFVYRNDGLQNQNVLYTQKGIDGTPELLIDPNTWSPDGTVRLLTFAPSKDARFAVYGRSRSGSDWQEYGVIDLRTRKVLDDKIEWVKVSNVAWRGDGFFYSRYPAPASGTELSSSNEHHRVFFHRLGTPQSADELVFEDAAHPQRFHILHTTDDERFAVLEVHDRGTGKQGNALFVRDLTAGAATFQPLIPSIGDDTFELLGNDGDDLLVATNRGAPNRRVVRIDPRRPAESNWTTVLPEAAEPLEGVSMAGRRLFGTYMKDVTARARAFGLDGRLEHEIVLPGPGTADGFRGDDGSTFVLYTFTSFTAPTTIYRYDIATGRSALFQNSEIAGFDPAAFETRQVFATSKDGTRVPMFLVHRKGLVLNGDNPTVMYGYGGFNVPTVPNFNPLRLALLERGVIYASVNMRGGSEYGESWHKAGTKLQKQNVFDDFIASAEWLIANKYTSSARLAMVGGSNGGLLVGAVANQRPELFRVAVPQVGVMDMLRFHKFTIGWNWIADFGSSDNPDEFKALFAYSPLHNIRSGARYPAVLITTADHDDRVVPAHSFKYAAAMQAAVSSERPVLIRVERRSGHGASSTAKLIDTTADVYAFILDNIGENIGDNPGNAR